MNTVFTSWPAARLTARRGAKRNLPMCTAVAAAIILVCMIGSVAEADDPPMDRVVHSGSGSIACGQVFSNNIEGAAGYNFDEAAFFVWAQGWMSAMNMALTYVAGSEAMTDLSASSHMAQKAYIRAFCSNNPLKPYYLAVEALLDEMREKQGQRDWRKMLSRHQLAG